MPPKPKLLFRAYSELKLEGALATEQRRSAALEESLAIARKNAREAGVGKLIEFREGDAVKLPLPSDEGLIVCNPPYGERMLEQKSAQQLYADFGRRVRGADGWKKYIISSEPDFEHFFGAPAKKKRKLYNGRLQCNLYMYF